MKSSSWRERLLESTRGQILALLRIENRTVSDLAKALSLTENAVRAHLVSLERDGLVQRAGVQRGVRKPHASYRLSADAELIFPRAYGPLLDLLMTVVFRRLGPAEIRESMREIGRMVAAPHLEVVAGKTSGERIEIALQVLEGLGGMARIEEGESGRLIRGHGCPLSAATARHPEACLIAESLLSEITGSTVKECCERGEQPSCCFQIAPWEATGA
jgi:predicted ArsR family transcriptional regulator